MDPPSPRVGAAGMDGTTPMGGRRDADGQPAAVVAAADSVIIFFPILLFLFLHAGGAPVGENSDFHRPFLAYGQVNRMRKPFLQ